MFHDPASQTNRIINQSFSSEYGRRIEINRREYFIIKHRLPITPQLNHSQHTCVPYLRCVEETVTSWNIAYLTHNEWIILNKVLLKYWSELKKMFHHRPSITYSKINQSFSLECCRSIDLSRRKYYITNIDYTQHDKSIIFSRVLSKYFSE